ncbi:MAG: VTT domain-containing protein [Thermoanaerobaculia bacterium]
MQDILRALAEHGPWIVFFNVFLEQVGIPVPALPTLIVAGALAARGELSAPALLAAALLATLTVDTAWFFLGRRHGQRILKTLCRVSLSPDSCVRQTRGVFERWGMPSLIVARFITGFSTVAPPLAGAMGARLGPFLFYDTLGTFLWAGSGLLVGHVFHRAIDRILESLEHLGSRALFVLGGALVLFVLLKWYQRRRFYRTLRMARIGIEELRDLIGRGAQPLVLDVRSEVERRRQPQRIPGARPIETEAVDRDLSGVPAGSEIILYCT